MNVQNKLSEIYMAVDLGVKGAITLFDKFTSILVAFEMPKIAITKTRFEVDLKKLNNLIKDSLPIKLAVIEQPPIIPINGKIAIASLFKQFGELRGLLIAYNVPFLQPDPKVWKAEILKGTLKNKEAAINYVLRKYPNFSLPTLGPRSKKYHDGIADACCLLEYGLNHDN